jgi:hypothetical protein
MTVSQQGDLLVVVTTAAGHEQVRAQLLAMGDIAAAAPHA